MFDYTLLTSKSSCRGFLDPLEPVLLVTTIGSHAVRRVGNHRWTCCPLLLEKGFKVSRPRRKRTNHSLQDIFIRSIYPFFAPLS